MTNVEQQDTETVKFGTDGWGLHIDRMHKDPYAPQILYKVKRSGCCLVPAMENDLLGCIPFCKEPKKRSYLWITESGVEQNAACLHPGCCCLPEISDFIFKVYFDNEMFEENCILGPKGIATEQDVNYICFCINCVCYYNMCTKPCFGGEVRTVRVANTSPMYPCATRCCPQLCTQKVFGFVANSNEAKEHLLSAMRQAEAMKKTMKGVKTTEVEVMDRA